MALVYKDRVKETTTTTGTGTLTLAGAATGYQAFSAIGNANTCIYALEDANGTGWEVGIGTYTLSGTTLARTTILASSNSGSAITLSAGTHSVFVTAESSALQKSFYNSRGLIEGGELTYSSTTAITVAACRVNINGTIRETSGTTTLTSGSTMVNLAGSTVTLGASKCYFVYAYNNSGTLEFRIVERTGSGEGADPTWDSVLDYWKAPSTGAEARRIGKFWTNTSSEIGDFWNITIGRSVAFSIENAATWVLLSGGTSTSYASITVTPYMTADDLAIKVGLQIGRSPAGPADVIMLLSIDGGTTPVANIGCADSDSAVTFVRLRPVVIPYKGSLHYAVSGTNAAGTVILLGSEYMR
jgi:hypothetical protein